MAQRFAPVRLDSAGTTLLLAAVGDTVDLIYAGSALPAREDAIAVHTASQHGKHENQPDMPLPPGLLPQTRDGYAGPPALRLARAGERMATRFQLDGLESDDHQICARWNDPKNALVLECTWRMSDEGMVRSRYRLFNDGKQPIRIEQFPSLVLPLPAVYDRVTAFPGRWAREMSEETQAIGRGSTVFRSRGGKPGYAGGNWLVFGSENDKECIGYHLAWSGDHYSAVQRDEDGRVLFVGGVSPEALGFELAPGEEYSSPEACFAWGLDQDDVTCNFHSHVRDSVLPERSGWPPRKVHLNSWEALGFDLGESQLIQLARDAAELGVERFVLDDGWFLGRRNDCAGLGDWEVDPGIFPEGLKPLIDHVGSLGMDFGLWVEPEMVSPDSDLYRAHPGWCLHDDAINRPTERNQLVLDLSRAEVRDHIFDALDRLLAGHDIAYLKWDHNRRLFPMEGAQGSAPTAQTEGFYDLLDRLRAAHPHVEIESCSSGGGRVDLELLGRCHRVWPSDNNDPIERIRIMTGWSRFLPLEVLGNHVGPSPNPVTGRKTDMDFRCKVALFGHFGVEANPAEMSEQERDNLRAHIALYKAWRALLHRGDYYRLDSFDHGIFAHMVADGDRGIAMAAQTGFGEAFNAWPIRLKGLEPDKLYRVTLPKPWPRKAQNHLPNKSQWQEGLKLSGRALMRQGLALPLTHPETAWLIALEKVKA